MKFPATPLPPTARAAASKLGVVHLAAGLALAALSFPSPARGCPGPGPAAGKQASGAVGPTLFQGHCHG